VRAWKIRPMTETEATNRVRWVAILGALVVPGPLAEAKETVHADTGIRVLVGSWRWTL
jgi:hypothetical protein